MLRYPLLAAYIISWAGAWALVTFFGALPLAELLNSSQRIDDDWLWLMLPVGAAFGVWFALRTRGWRVLHLTCLPLGLAAAAPVFWAARRLAERAEAVRGNGPLAGLGETILSLLAVVLGVTALLVATGGGLGTLLRWHTRRRTNR